MPLRRLLVAAIAFLAIAAAATTGAPALAQRPAGAMLIVLNKAEASASLIALDDGRTITKIPVGDGPHEVAVSPDARWAVVANYGTGQAPGTSLTVIDLRTLKADRTIDLGEYRRPHGLAYLPGGKRVLITSETNRALVIVDVASGKVDRVIPTGQNGSHLFVLARDGKRAWVSNIGAGTTSLVDIERGEVVKSAPTGRAPEAIDVSPDGREVWSGDGQLDRVLILDANTLDTLGALPAGGRPNRVKFSLDGRWVFNSNIRSGTVNVYDARARTLVETLVFPVEVNPSGNAAGATPTTAPEGILLSPDGKKVWVALSGADRIVEIDVASRKVIRYLTTGRAPDGMDFVR